MKRLSRETQRIASLLRETQRIASVLFVVLLLAFGSFGQSVVNQLENVKKPGMGKLYFSKKDSGVYVWKGRWSKMLQETGFGSAQPPITNPPVVVPPVVVPPVLEEIPLGYWDAPDRLLVAKLLDGKYHLLQTNAARSYYVPRGKNLLSDSRTKVNSDVLTGDLLPSLVSGNSDLGGLYPPATFKDALMTTKGFVKNVQGEWVFGSAQTPGVGLPVSEKIKIPVGAIMWDSWYRDYWNDPNPNYNLLINVVSKQRLIATEYMDKFRVVPFYGQYHEPEKIKIRYNVRWSPELGRNDYDEVERYVNVKFDKTQRDTDREIQYYAEAGFDFLCFNYYNSDSPLSEARLQFVNSSNKRGLKMTFIIAPERSNAEIDYITDLMTKEYWFKIDNKPVLYFDKNEISDLAKYRSAFAKKGGGEIYFVYYNGGGYPDGLPIFQVNGAKAASSYTLFMGQATADDLIKAEVSARESWMRQFQYTGLSLIPVLTTGFENLYNRSSLDKDPVKYIEKASLSQIDEKLELMKGFIKQYPDKVPAVLWYAANEMLESGNPIVPTKRRDGSIDTSMLDAIKRHLE